MTNSDLLTPSAPPTTTADPRPGTALTRRNWQVLNFIRETLQRQGYPPSLREICEAVGVTSTSTAAYQLRELAKKGYIALTPGRPRSYRIIGEDHKGPKVPVMKHIGCPLLAGEGAHEQPEDAVVLQVVLDPAVGHALRAGALLTVQHLRIPNARNSAPDVGAILDGQVIAVAHPMSSPPWGGEFSDLAATTTAYTDEPPVLPASKT